MRRHVGRKMVEEVLTKSRVPFICYWACHDPWNKGNGRSTGRFRSKMRRDYKVIPLTSHVHAVIGH
jgi:hypothetical protein